jgi:hypothetical protein
LRGAAGIGLSTTIKYLRDAAGIGLGTTIKYLRRATSGAAGVGTGHYDSSIFEPKGGRGKQLGQGPLQNAFFRIMMTPPVM